MEYTSAKEYVNGVYQHMVIGNREGVPLVRFTGVKGWPHTYTREVAMMIWDEFFCRFSRDEKAVLRYMGEIVEQNE